MGMWSQNSHYPGEVFFIPRPGAEAEDDGSWSRWCSTGSRRSPTCSCSTGGPSPRSTGPTSPSRSPSHSTATGSQSFTERLKAKCSRNKDLIKVPDKILLYRMYHILHGQNFARNKRLI